eukprot:GHVU01087734.1.p1 GENE.GHVU01087734.1~~GHVU01087734.1.p1  ORF type:complete len:119 (+),score=0.75 GHVU01087734.1:632-988(+)
MNANASVAPIPHLPGYHSYQPPPPIICAVLLPTLLPLGMLAQWAQITHSLINSSIRCRVHFAPIRLAVSYALQPSTYFRTADWLDERLDIYTSRSCLVRAAPDIPTIATEKGAATDCT